MTTTLSTLVIAVVFLRTAFTIDGAVAYVALRQGAKKPRAASL